MCSEERQPTDGEEWSWSSTITGEAGERWTPDTRGKQTSKMMSREEIKNRLKGRKTAEGGKGER